MQMKYYERSLSFQDRISIGFGSSFIRRSIYLCFILTPVVDILNGHLQISFGSTYGVAVLWKSQLFLFATLYLLCRKVDQFYLIYILLPALSLFFAVAINGWFSGFLVEDIFSTMRGFLLMIAVYGTLSLFSKNEGIKICGIFFKALWFCIFFSISMSYLFGIGNRTYKSLEAAEGFYLAANEITVAFAVASAWLVHVEPRKFVGKGIYFLLSVSGLFMLGTKAGWIILAACLLWIFGNKILKNRVLMFGFAILSGLLICINLEQIVSMIGPYLLTWERVSWAIEKSGFWGGISSGRLDRFLIGMGILVQLPPLHLIFGLGLGLFHSMLGKYFGVLSLSAETDILDVLGGYGLLGFVWYYGLFLFSIGRTFLKRIPFYDYVMAIAFGLVVCSLLAGHVATAATPSIIVGILLWILLYKDPMSRPLKCS